MNSRLIVWLSFNCLWHKWSCAWYL